MRDYQTKDNDPSGSPAPASTYFNAQEFNSISQELTNAVESADLTPAVAAGTSETFFQLAQAMTIVGGGGAEFCVDTGNFFSVVLNPVSPIVPAPAYYEGMMLTFKANQTNTTTNIFAGYNGYTLQPLLHLDGVVVEVGGIKAGNIYTIKFTADGVDRFELIRGALMVQDVVSPSSGYFVLPRGIDGEQWLIQWGAGSGSSAGLAVSFVENYATAGDVSRVFVTDSGSSAFYFSAYNYTASGFTCTCNDASSNAMSWLAIGTI